MKKTIINVLYYELTSNYAFILFEKKNHTNSLYKYISYILYIYTYEDNSLIFFFFIIIYSLC